MKTMNHAEYQKRCRTMSPIALRYTITDCQETLRHDPHGKNAGYYADEIHYCAAELKRRGL